MFCDSLFCSGVDDVFYVRRCCSFDYVYRHGTTNLEGYEMNDSGFMYFAIGTFLTFAASFLALAVLRVARALERLVQLREANNE